jgi:hypothetical protein
VDLRKDKIMAKTYDKKNDFIEFIASMSHNELNDYIKRHGSDPKPVVMVREVDKSKTSSSEVK